MVHSLRLTEDSRRSPARSHGNNITLVPTACSRSRLDQMIGSVWAAVLLVESTGPHLPADDGRTGEANNMDIMYHGESNLPKAELVVSAILGQFAPFLGGAETLPAQLQGPLPAAAWDATRQQWKADLLLRLLLTDHRRQWRLHASPSPPGGTRCRCRRHLVLILADVDAYVEPLSWVFGVAVAGHGCLVSTRAVGGDADLLAKVCPLSHYCPSGQTQNGIWKRYMWLYPG